MSSNMDRKSVSFMVDNYQHNYSTEASEEERTMLQTSTPFVPLSTVHCPQTSDLDGSLFDAKSHSSLEMSSITEQQSHEESVTETSNVQDIDKPFNIGFIQTSEDNIELSGICPQSRTSIEETETHVYSHDNKPTSSTSNENVSENDSHETESHVSSIESENVTEVTEHKSELGSTTNLPTNDNKSIYIDVNISKSKLPQPKRKRLTRSEQATIEALASFGGCDLGSVICKKKSFSERLAEEKEAIKEDGPQRKKTRLEIAKSEAQITFQDIPLGKPADQNPTIQSEKPANLLSNENTKRLTRVEKARLEALQSFGGSGLDDVMTGSRKKVALTLEKKQEESKENEPVPLN